MFTFLITINKQSYFGKELKLFNIKLNNIDKIAYCQNCLIKKINLVKKFIKK